MGISKPEESADISDERDRSEGVIDSFSDDTYEVLRPLKIKYQHTDEGFIASFPEANIAISGVSRQDAYQALVVEILDAFDDWSADESALGLGPRQQQAVLRKHIAKATS
jgi:hypothetical protein